MTPRIKQATGGHTHSDWRRNDVGQVSGLNDAWLFLSKKIELFTQELFSILMGYMAVSEKTMIKKLASSDTRKIIDNPASMPDLVWEASPACLPGRVLSLHFLDRA